MQNNKLGLRHRFKLQKVKEVLRVLSSNDQLCFKGGTALSLTYQLIARFSEDIDITIFKGQNTYEQNIKWILNVCQEISWKEKIIHIKKKQFIEIYFQNNHPPVHYNHHFLDNKIIIEYSNKERKTDSYAHSYQAPYSDADFKMNVMSLEHIFVDKTAILIEKLSANLNFNWATTGRVEARHIYDVQMIIEQKNYKKVDSAYIYKRIYDVTLKKTGEFRGGIEKSAEIKNKTFFYNLSIKNAFELFKSELLKQEVEIIEKINLLVYPGADKFKIKKLILQYQPIFRYIFKITKANSGKRYIACQT